jgi:uncharacterized protein YukE
MKKTVAVPLYGVAIQEAIASGNAGQMKKIAAEAEKHLKKFGDVSGSLKNLQAEIDRLESTKRSSAADMVPYGDALRASVKSGDLKQMKDTAKQAEKWVSKATEVNKALADIRKEIKRLETKK